MRIVGTFLGVIAMAMAVAVSADNQTQPMVLDESIISNSTNVDLNNRPNDKGIIDWITQLFNGGQTHPIPTDPPADPGLPEIPEKCTECKCGIANKRNRIVGGQETQENQYPWMAVLLYSGRFYCGGSVINSRYVLTAAHCVEGFEKSKLTVRLLVHDRESATNSKVQDFKVIQVIRHGSYSIFNYNNDIALIKVTPNIVFDDVLRPVCLPELSKTFAGEKGIVTGWGAIDASGPISNVLREVTVPILSNAECKASKYPEKRITDNMLCAGYKEGGKDSCQGDSGGPLHVVNNSIYCVVGVVSWGEGCAAANYPGVYARVNRYLTWIHRNTKDGCYC